MDRIRICGSEIFVEPKHSFPVVKADFSMFRSTIYHSVKIKKRKFPETFALVFTSNLTEYFKDKSFRTVTNLS